MSNRDCWETPNEIFQTLDLAYDFWWDACCDEDNCKVFEQQQYFKNNRFGSFMYDFLQVNTDSMLKARDYLGLEAKEYIFMNPPFSNIGPFLSKAWELSTVFPFVILVKEGITTCKYMDKFDKRGGGYFIREWKDGFTILNMNSRVKYIPPAGVKESGPSFGSMVILMDRRSVI